MPLREPRKIRIPKSSSRANSTAVEIVQSITSSHRQRIQQVDKSTITSKSVKAAWGVAISSYIDSLEGKPPALHPATNTAYSLFVKRSKDVKWGNTVWADMLEDIAINWDTYLTRFEWKTYNQMPGTPDLMYVAMNLRFFLQYYQEPKLSNTRAVRNLQLATESLDTVKDKVPSNDSAIGKLRLTIQDQKSQIDHLNSVLRDATLTIKEQERQIHESRAEALALMNWAKARGYSKETNILEAIYDDFVLPAKLT